jgi:hypothetical protein
MTALSMFLVLLALFISASHANALSSVTGNHVRVIHLIRLWQPMSNPTNEPSRKTICKPTNQINLDAELPSNLSSKGVKYSLSQKQDAELPSKIIDTQNTQTCWLCHNKKSELESLLEQPIAATNSSQWKLPIGLSLRSANFTLSADLDLRSANPILSAGLGLRSARTYNLQAGLGVHGLPIANFPLPAGLSLHTQTFHCQQALACAQQTFCCQQALAYAHQEPSTCQQALACAQQTPPICQ